MEKLILVAAICWSLWIVSKGVRRVFTGDKLDMKRALGINVPAFTHLRPMAVAMSVKKSATPVVDLDSPTFLRRSPRSVASCSALPAETMPPVVLPIEAPPAAMPNDADMASDSMAYAMSQEAEPVHHDQDREPKSSKRNKPTRKGKRARPPVPEFELIENF
jgi:hypothetical protein